MICSVNIKRAFYGERQVLKDISFDVEEGSILAIVGESGAGKTTLGRLISGLYRFYPLTYEGKIESRATIDVIPQNITDSLDPVFTIKDQLLEITDDLGYIKSVLRTVGLKPDEVLRAYPSNLSGGMRQRILIAMAILRANLIVADEFTSALDAITKIKVVKLLKELNRSRGISLIFITHDLDLLDFDGDVIVLFDGKILEIGRVKDIKSNPLHPYTKFLLNSSPKLDLRYTNYRFEELNIDKSLACPFYNSCEFAQDRCRDVEPKLKRRGDRWIRCHF